VLLGMGLIAGEAFAPSGALGIGGTAAMILGAIILFDIGVPGFQLSWQVLGAVAAVSLALTAIIVRLAWTSHRRAVVTGPQELVGGIGTVRSWKGQEGYVFVHGERWKAVSPDPLAKGKPVRIIGREGLVLKVASADDEDAETRGERQ